jgi:hypothetical protein
LTDASDLQGYIGDVRDLILDMEDWCGLYQDALPEQAAELRKTLREHAATAIDSAAALRRRLRARVAARKAELVAFKKEIKEATARDERTLEIIDREIFDLLEEVGVGETCKLETATARASLRWSPESVGERPDELALDTLPASLVRTKTTIELNKKAALAALKAGETFPGLYRHRGRKVEWK